MNVQAIETIYKGFKFRSRLEARWAVFFDALKINFQYELEGFNLGDSLFYLPDFYLPEFNSWVEIKAKAPDPTEVKKAQLLSEQSSQNVIVLYGNPSLPTINPAELPSIMQWQYSAMKFYGNFKSTAPMEIFLMGYETLPEYLRGHEVDAPDFDGSIQSARTLRALDRSLHVKLGDLSKHSRLDNGVFLDGLLWSLHGSRKYVFAPEYFSTIDEFLLSAFAKAQQARFEYGDK